VAAALVAIFLVALAGRAIRGALQAPSAGRPS
jgi:hypothetical protein